MRLKRMGDWIQYVTESGQTFYYNEKNADFQWHPPKSIAGNSNSNKSLSSNSSSHKRGIDNNVVDAAVDARNNQQHQRQGSLDSGTLDDGRDGFGNWRPYKDPASGELFWYNEVTHVSQWETPAEVEYRGNGSYSGDNYYDHEIFQVHNEDDLGI